MAGLIVVLATLSTAFLILVYLRRRTSPHLPPGPKKLPLIGNLLDMPTEKEWLKFTQWANQYGDIVSVSVFGQQYVIVNSAKTAVELLEKKSRIYSDRPFLAMCGELIGWKDILGLLPYGSRLRNYRKMIHHIVGTPNVVSKFNNVGEEEMHRLLKRLVTSPEDFLSHIKRATGSIVLRISYGYETRDGKDPFVSIADTAMDQFALSASSGRFLVNLVPALRHLPDWFPGTGFKHTARAWRKTLYDMVEGPFRFVKQEMANGKAEHSLVSELLRDESNLSTEKINDIKWAAASFYAGGSDTTVITLYAFFKAMVLYPEVQKKAQAEIDAVIGNNRLPSIEDREKLPYLSALVTEVFRWHVVGPTGTPHRVIEDDIHDGYIIPKGATIISNMWYMARDPSVYRSPITFDPERFMGLKPEPDPRGIVFGFGRRICPGRLLADASAFMACVMILAVIDITPHMDNGKPVIPDLEQEGTMIISYPSPFKCNIKPRSQKALSLINSPQG